MVHYDRLADVLSALQLGAAGDLVAARACSKALLARVDPNGRDMLSRMVLTTCLHVQVAATPPASATRLVTWLDAIEQSGPAGLDLMASASQFVRFAALEMAEVDGARLARALAACRLSVDRAST